MASDRVLDGNALAGLLGEVFAHEMTSARGACGACGAIEHLGAEHAYLDAPGAVLRCCHCENVLMVVVRSEERYRVGLQGLRWLELRAGG